MSDLETFLLYAAKHAAWDRFIPFPDAYRRTTTPGTPHTKLEYDGLMMDLYDINNHPALYKFITSPKLSMVKHNENSIHRSIVEYEFKYDLINDLIINRTNPERWYLFHGSALSNWYSILHNGIKNMSGTPFMSNGAAYGTGVYLTDNINLAYSYGGHGKTHFVAVVELLVDPEQFKKITGIYVVPDDKLLFPRYLLTINANPTYRADDLLVFYKKLRMSLIADKTKVRRLDGDIAELKSYLLEILPNGALILSIGQIIVRCYVFNYPFSPPILQLAYELKESDHLKHHFDERGIYLDLTINWMPSFSLLSQIEIFKDLIAGASITNVEYPLIS